jgi:hypothetical protein
MLKWGGAEVEGFFNTAEVHGAFNRTFDYFKGTLSSDEFF